MEREITLSNGDGDETLTLIPQYSAAEDSHKGIGGGGDGEFKAVEAEIEGLKAENQELEAQLEVARRERGVVAAQAHRLEGEIERARADLFAASSAAMDAEAKAEILGAEIARLSEAKDGEIAALERRVRALEEAKEEAAKASAEREEDLKIRNLFLVEKIREKDDDLIKLSERNSSLEEEIIELKDALVVLEGEIGEKKKNDAEATAPDTAAALGAVALGVAAATAAAVAAAAVTAVYLHRRR